MLGVVCGSMLVSPTLPELMYQQQLEAHPPYQRMIQYFRSLSPAEKALFCAKLDASMQGPKWHRDLNYHNMWVAEALPYRLYVDGERFTYRVVKCGLLEEWEVSSGSTSYPVATQTLKDWAISAHQRCLSSSTYCDTLQVP